MWICPRCETINTNPNCIICSEPKPVARVPVAPAPVARPVAPVSPAVKPAPTAAPVAPVAPRGPMPGEKRGLSRGAIALIALGVLATIIALLFIIRSAMRSAAYEDGCNYMAMGEYHLAREEFEDIKGYKDVDELLKECSYQEALELYYDDSLFEAKEIFEGLGYYSSSYYYLSEIEEDMFEEGVDQYEMGYYSDAETYFAEVEDSYSYAIEKYRLLIRAWNGEATYDEILPLLKEDFADSGEVVEAKFMSEFLNGTWENASGTMYIDYETGVNFSTNLTTNGLPYVEFDENVHYEYSDTDRKKMFTYNVWDYDEIYLQNHVDNSYHYMYRK